MMNNAMNLDEKTMEPTNYKWTRLTRLAYCAECNAVYVFQADSMPHARIAYANGARTWHVATELMSCPNGHTPLRQTTTLNRAQRRDMSGNVVEFSW